MKRANKETLYFETGADNAPTLRVEPGEQFEVETQMNRGPWIDAHPDSAALSSKLIGGNPSSGCVYIEEIEPGDTLAVRIDAVEPGSIGFTRFGGSTGAMPGRLGASALGDISRIVSIENRAIRWSDTLTLDIRPMLGFVGVAPAVERHHNGWGGYWGGNFDIQEATDGATVYLPVFVPGALLHVGDMHAIQGDGEICGAGGIETEGIARLTCDVIRGKPPLDYPRIENESHLIAVAMERPAEDAFRSALERLLHWLVEDYGMNMGDAYLLLGQVLEARCTQFVNPTFSYVAKVAKKYLS
jgi:amidase